MKVGKHKTKIRFDVNHIYSCHPDHRCILQYDSNYLTMPLHEAQSLWIQIGRSYGISEARLKRYMLEKNDPDRPTSDYLRGRRNGEYDVK